MIRLEDIHKTYVVDKVGNHVLRGVSLAVAEGEFVALMGASGSGKSTLLNIIGALDQDYTGRAQIAGQEVKGLSDRALSRFRNRTVAYIFQQFHLLPHLSVLENVVMPSWFARSGEAGDDKALAAKATAVLDKVGLRHKVRARPGHLSGGEKQRVAIARALFNQPKLLLCDEPTGALDSDTTLKVFELIERLNAEEGLTVLVVTHERDIAERCRRIVRIVDGAVVPDPGPMTATATAGAGDA
ncbi:MAG: macrolide ABC transporter ATP-binding protein [Deltaproteobacteria bacterium HGW-Deltaproteobacteria-14]|nr:MAG: macrolide ABC transporter ATP-binding protein [Deltaproteobacteria bacterium HGW-Deltaproteobacteria-14]